MQVSPPSHPHISAPEPLASYFGFSFQVSYLDIQRGRGLLVAELVAMGALCVCLPGDCSFQLHLLWKQSQRSITACARWYGCAGVGRLGEKEGGDGEGVGAANLATVRALAAGVAGTSQESIAAVAQHLDDQGRCLMLLALNAACHQGMDPPHPSTELHPIVARTSWATEVL